MVTTFRKKLYEECYYVGTLNTYQIIAVDTKKDLANPLFSKLFIDKICCFVMYLSTSLWFYSLDQSEVN